jgi:hypothetical protein
MSCSHGPWKKKQTGKDLADSKYSSQRTKTTRFEDDLLASMGHEYPSCLFKADDLDDVATKEFGFTTCTSYTHWIGAGAKQSYKRILSNRLEVYVTGVKGVLKRYPSGSVYWADQARTLLDKVVAQFVSLCSFIETFYKELTEISRFKAISAWGLVGRCVGAIFADQVRVRSTAALLEDTSTLRNKTAVIATILKCHEVYRVFEDVKFRAHPEIVKEMSLFMLTERVDPVEMISLRVEVCDAVTTATEAKKLANSYKEKFDKLTKELGELKTNVGNLKAPGKKRKNNNEGGTPATPPG